MWSIRHYVLKVLACIPIQPVKSVISRHLFLSFNLSPGEHRPSIPRWDPLNFSDRCGQQNRAQVMRREPTQHVEKTYAVLLLIHRKHWTKFLQQAKTDHTQREIRTIQIIRVLCTAMPFQVC